VPTVRKTAEVEAKTVGPEAPGVTMRVLIGPEQGAPNFVMRRFEVAEGGSTPFHAHPWEHEVYVVSGTGAVAGENSRQALEGGDSVFVPGGEKHNFVNMGKQPFVFLCVIPGEQSCKRG